MMKRTCMLTFPFDLPWTSGILPLITIWSAHTTGWVRIVRRISEKEPTFQFGFGIFCFNLTQSGHLVVSKPRKVVIVLDFISMLQDLTESKEIRESVMRKLQMTKAYLTYVRERCACSSASSVGMGDSAGRTTAYWSGWAMHLKMIALRRWARQ